MHMNSVQRKHNGLGYFNLLRGLGLLFIILGHSIAPFLTQQTPVVTGSVFHGAGRVLGGGILTLFFMISGLGYYRRSPRKCLAVQSRLLLKPYLLASLAIILCRMILNFFKGAPYIRIAIGNSITFLLGLNASRGGSIGNIPLTTISILWFVVALFGGWVLYNQIQQLPQKKHRYYCILGCLMLSWILSMISKVWPFALPMVLQSVVYIWAGHEIRKRHLLYRRLTIPAWCVLGFMSLISLMFGYVDMAACVWKLGPIDMIGSVCIAFFILRLYSRFMQPGIRSAVVSHLEQLGMNSIRILCLHAVEHAVIPWKNLLKLLPNAPVLCAVICLLLKTAIIWGLYHLIFHLLRKKKKPVTIEL